MIDLHGFFRRISSLSYWMLFTFPYTSFCKQLIYDFLLAVRVGCPVIRILLCESELDCFIFPCGFGIAVQIITEIDVIIPFVRIAKHRMDMMRTSVMFNLHF